jgi:hypothetical protein
MSLPALKDGYTALRQHLVRGQRAGHGQSSSWKRKHREQISGHLDFFSPDAGACLSSQPFEPLTKNRIQDNHTLESDYVSTHVVQNRVVTREAEDAKIVT